MHGRHLSSVSLPASFRVFSINKFHEPGIMKVDDTLSVFSTHALPACAGSAGLLPREPRIWLEYIVKTDNEAARRQVTRLLYGAKGYTGNNIPIRSRGRRSSSSKRHSHIQYTQVNRDLRWPLRMSESSWRRRMTRCTARPPTPNHRGVTAEPTVWPTIALIWVGERCRTRSTPRLPEDFGGGLYGLADLNF